MPTQITYTPDNDDIPELPIDISAVLAAAQSQRSLAQSASIAAQTKANEAALSASDSAFRAGEAAASAAEAAALILTYYGPMASDPPTRPSGAASATGDLYYNTTTFKLRIYSGTAWADAAASTLGSAAYRNTGTSGNTVPLLDGANAWSATQTFGTFNLNNGMIRISGSNGAADQKLWDIWNGNDASNSLYFRILNDAGTASYDWMAVARNGYQPTAIIWRLGAGVEVLRLDPAGPRAADGSYYNWGATSGSTGYGLRDNAGVIEAKNSGGAWTPVLASASVQLATRQTAFSGPVDASGFPSFLPATSDTLSITTQNVTASAPLGVSAAQGFNSNGKIDYASQFAANQTWGSLTASSTLYLYVNAQTGALGFTSLVPIYQHGGTPATTNGQFTFNVAEMRGYMGDGSTAPATPIVFIGEVVTGASSVTSATAYAYNGRYDSGWTNTLPAGGSAVSRNHNLGVNPYDARFSIECITAEFGWSVGDQIVQPVWQVVWQGSGYGAAVTSTRNAVKLAPNAAYPTPALLRADNGNGVNLTAANWKYKFVVSRGW